MRLLAATFAGLALTTAASAQTAAPAGPSTTDLAEAREVTESAPANALTVTGTLTFASRYVSDGIEYSTGGVVQPYVELGYAGFYAGIWATNAAEELLGSDSEVDYHLGYRGEVGAFYYDVGYGYYTYPGASDLNSSEWLLNGGVGLNETIYLTAGFAYSTEFETLDSSLLVDYYTPIEGLSLAASYGYNDAWSYWTIGAGYAFTEAVSVDLTWNDTDIDDLDGVLVFALSTSFNLR
jgi:uncharacterized protein (TIGR02001 family)